MPVPTACLTAPSAARWPSVSLLRPRSAGDRRANRAAAPARAASSTRGSPENAGSAEVAIAAAGGPMRSWNCRSIAAADAGGRAALRADAGSCPLRGGGAPAATAGDGLSRGRSWAGQLSAQPVWARAAAFARSATRRSCVHLMLDQAARCASCACRRIASARIDAAGRSCKNPQTGEQQVSRRQPAAGDSG